MKDQPDQPDQTRGSRRGLALYVLVLVVLFVPPFVLTAMRLVGPDGGRGAVLVSLTPFGLPLYALLALVALLGFVGRRRAPRRVPAAVALLVALAGVGAHVWWLAPSFSGDRPPAAAGTTPFGVLSLNLQRGGADPVAVIRAATSRDVSVLVLVEITPRSLEALDAAGLQRAFPFRAGQAVPNTGGTMILSSSRVSDLVALDDSAHGAWAATVALPQGPQRVWAVHPRRPQDGGDGWRTDLETLQRDLRTMVPPDIMAGDFNATLDHQRLRDLLAAGLRDAAEADNTGWMPTWPANGDFFRLPRFVQIDHVLLGPALTAVTTARVDVPDTDHSGVFTRVAYR